MKKEVDPLDDVITYEYNKYGRMASSTDANGNKTTYEYDANGNCTKKTAPDGSVVKITYDSQNRMLTATAVVDEDTEYTVSYVYDELGMLAEYTTKREMSLQQNMAA